MTDTVWAGSVVNAGTLTLTPGDRIVVGDPSTSPSATLSGGGSVVLVESTSIVPFGVDSVLTNLDNLISGGGVAGTPATIDVTLVNGTAGVVTALGDGGAHPIQLVVTGNVTNHGVLEAQQGADLVLQGIDVDNADGTIEAFDAGSRVVFDGTTVTGGHLATDGDGSFLVADATFRGSGVAPLFIDGHVDVAAGHALTLAGTVVASQDTIGLEPGASLLVDAAAPVRLYGTFVQTTTLASIAGTGAGAVLDLVDSAILATGGDVASGVDGNVVSADLVIRGHSAVAAAGDGAGHGLLTVSGDSLNYGSLYAASGGKMVIDGGLQNAGLLGSLFGGTLVLDADVTGKAGQLYLMLDGVIDIAARVEGNVSFEGTGGVVDLEAGGDFVGVWSGAAGAFDLLAVPAPPSPGAYGLTYTANARGTGGLLALTDGGTTLWSVEVAGRYAASDFTVGDNGSGATRVSGGTVSQTNWTKGASGSWLDPSGWDAGVPAPWSQVRLNGGVPAYEVTVSTDQTLYGIGTEADTTLRIAGGTFWANGGTGAHQNAGTIQVDSGATFNTSGAFLNLSGQLNADGGTIGLYAARLREGSISLGSGAILQSVGFDSVLSNVEVTGQTLVARRPTVQAILGGSLTILSGQVVKVRLNAAAAAPGTPASSIALGDTVLRGVTLTGGGRFETLASTRSTVQNVLVSAGSVLDVVAGSEIDVLTALTVSGTVRVGDAGGTGRIEMANPGVLQGLGTIALVDGVIVTSGRAPTTVTINTTVSGTGRIGDATMILSNRRAIRSSGGQLLIDTAGNAIANRGLLEGGTGGGLVLASSLTNLGTLQTAASGGTVTVARVANRGTIDNAAAGTITANGALVNEASGAVANGGTYDQHAALLNRGSLTNFSGTFTVDGFFTNAGTVQVDGGLLALTAAVNNAQITVGRGAALYAGGLTNGSRATLTNFGAVTVGNGLINKGTVKAEVGRFFVGGGQIDNFGTISVTMSAQFLAGMAFNGATGVLTNQGSAEFTSVDNFGRLDNEGSLTVNGAFVNKGTFKADGLVELKGSAMNYATITTWYGISIDGLFTNQGTLQAKEGVLELKSGTLNTGTITTAAASTVIHDDLLRNWTGATLTTAGTYTVNASLLNLGAIDAHGGHFSVGGTVDNRGSITVSAGGSFAAAVLKNRSGTLDVDGGSVSVSGRATGGSASLSNGGVLTFATVSSVDVAFDAADNTLILGKSGAYGGTLSNFVDGNLLAFLDMNAADSFRYSYTPNGSDTGGTLLLEDFDTGKAANIRFAGSGYTTLDFKPYAYTSDGISYHFALLSSHPAV